MSSLICLFSAREQELISIHDVGGRQIYNSKRTYGSGTHAIEAPLQANGIFIYKVNIGNESYSFKSSPFGSFSTGQSMVLSDAATTLAKQATATAFFSDIISVAKEGLQPYRDSMRVSDTSGIVIKMIPDVVTMTDADGNVYQSVRIGNQVWIVENLRTTKYNDGTEIPHVTDKDAWSDLSTPGYCFWENNTDPDYKEKWGAFYNWYTIKTGNLAPEGWHVPTNADWDTLENYLISNGYNWDGTTTENRIGKSLAATTDWRSDGTKGAVGNDKGSNNRTGFSGLPAAYRSGHGNFGSESSTGFWWSATKRDGSNVYYRYLFYGNEQLARLSLNKKHGFSVRLVWDY